MSTTNHPVVILGAGINGAALARELVLNRVPVLVVDTADAAYGTTAYSSRLIHGGLRYLEYADFALVRESLAERRRLLNLAPQFVRPLELQIPVAQRGGGWTSAVTRFFGIRSGAPAERGMWLINSGLWMYDVLARDRQLPMHRVLAVGSPGGVPVDAQRYRWLCSYWDAQMIHPERFVVALLEDARRAAGESGVEFSLYTYHRVHRDDTRLEISSVQQPGRQGEPVRVVEPAAVVNASGAWVDHTLRGLDITAPRKIGGTKGSHFLTTNPQLSEALSGRGLYAEAADGRPVFVLPLGAAVLVGTTDIAFEGDPGEAVASEAELEYLLGLVRQLLPQAPLTRDDIHLHYAGVRPLPYSGDKKPGAISRRHWMEKHLGGSLPLYSIIGGKLTTCRSLAEEAAGQLLKQLGRSPEANSRQRIVPGGEDYPPDDSALGQQQQQLAQRYERSPASIESVWSLLGTRTADVLEAVDACGSPNLADTDLPLSIVRWVIDNEWVTNLDDLVERRLMLLYDPRLSRTCLRQLAEQLTAAGRLAASAIDDAVTATLHRLESHFGKRVT